MTKNITIPNSSGCSIAVTRYMIVIETKNTPVGVKKVPCSTMSPEREM